MKASAEIQKVTRDVRDLLSWMQEEGIDTWKIPSPRPLREPLPVPPPAETILDPSDTRKSAPLSLEQIREEMGDCQRCSLAPGRTQLVFGVGDPNADLMFVGEGPGADEDVQGEPFVGKAGQLLTKMIGAMGLSRDQVYIANIVKCRPPGNRNPAPDEIATCRPFLDQQIAAIAPKVICALGKFSAQTLLNTQTRISDLRGHFHDWNGLKVLPTFHPAYLLRNPSEKKRVWADLKLIMSELALALPGKK